MRKVSELLCWKAQAQELIIPGQAHACSVMMSRRVGQPRQVSAEPSPACSCMAPPMLQPHGRHLASSSGRFCSVQGPDLLVFRDLTAVQLLTSSELLNDLE